MKKDTRKEAVWEVTYGMQSFYLTDAEKGYLIKSLANGAKYVEINGYVFTEKFLYIGMSDHAIDIEKQRRLMSSADGGDSV